MGYGSYSFTAHKALADARTKAPREAVFKQRKCHPLMNPHGIRVRESRDSETHPNSLGIVFALDVTGSMGDIPDRLARRDLPTFMKTLMACGIQDPQVLFMAVGLIILSRHATWAENLLARLKARHPKADELITKAEDLAESWTTRAVDFIRKKLS